jgi:hypothetical protein
VVVIGDILVTGVRGMAVTGVRVMTMTGVEDMTRVVEDMTMTGTKAHQPLPVPRGSRLRTVLVLVECLVFDIRRSFILTMEHLIRTTG